MATVECQISSGPSKQGAFCSTEQLNMLKKKKSFAHAALHVGS